MQQNRVEVYALRAVLDETTGNNEIEFGVNTTRYCLENLCQ